MFMYYLLIYMDLDVWCYFLLKVLIGYIKSFWKVNLLNFKDKLFLMLIYDRYINI